MLDALVLAWPAVAWHLGALHPAEKGLTLALAFGPFVVLGVVIAVRRRQDAAAEEPHPPADPAAPTDSADPTHPTD